MSSSETPAGQDREHALQEHNDMVPEQEGEDEEENGWTSSDATTSPTGSWRSMAIWIVIDEIRRDRDEI